MRKMDTLFPPGSWIRKLLTLVKDGLKVLKNEGIDSFLRKTWMIVRVSPTPSRIRLAKNFTPLAFARHESPEVSIVIPVFNKCLHTFNCLKSVSDNTTDVSYEIIVVDNASTDKTPEMLSVVKDINVIRNRENLGFVDACNAGASAARGKYIHFLNNDTSVTEGWLSSLLHIFEAHPLAGAAGSKLIYPNGKLQEAGGIIWKDASGWNYGKFDDPEKPEYNYVREVDYCSGASLMVRRSLFETIGGFDRRFAPAYWEDTDLCFSIRRSGFKVFYQPASVIIHFEGVSAGTDTTSGMKRYQEVNRPKFVEKWRDELAAQCENRAENVFGGRDRNAGKVVIIIDQRVPEHDKDAGSFFTFSLLNALISTGYRVVLWPHHLRKIEPYTKELQQKGVEVMYGSRNFARFMAMAGKYFDCAILTRTHIAIHYIDIVRKYIPKIIYHDPDFEYVREKRKVALEGCSARYLEKIKDREFYLFQQSDLITTHNEQEAALIRDEMPRKEVATIHLPISKITNMKTPFEDRRDLLFVGSSHPPNTDAIIFYADQIMPLLIKGIPGVRLYVIGANHDKKLKRINSENIIVTGFVKELLPYYEKCRIFLAPLRYGAGVKGKVIEAMSYGMPTVTTEVGAEGLGVISGEHLIVVNDKESIANAVSQLYADKELWEKLSRNAKRFAKDHFSQDAFVEKVHLIMGQVFRK